MTSHQAWPAGDLTRVPYRLYSDPHEYACEQERIFRGPVWHYIGLEAELPEAGDFKTTYVGDMPVIVVRDGNGVLRCFENRCAHRGALLSLKNRGRASDFTCVYHAWRHDLEGNLKGVAFLRGVNGEGGMPADFQMAGKGPRKLQVATFCGLVFGSVDPQAPDLADYLTEPIAARIRRVLHKPVEILGTYTQVLNNNWKLYFENVKDSYHSSLLHTFFGTFKVSRLSQGGGLIVSDSGAHHVSYSMAHRGGDDSAFRQEGLRSDREDAFGLEDRSVLDIVDEFGDGCHVQMLTVFPGFVLQAIHNSIAVRQILPRGVNTTHLHWTLLGFRDDSPRLRDLRLKHSNLVGPAGYVSMEDGAVGNFVQRGIAACRDEAAILEMGGREAKSGQTRASEASVRGFWKQYRQLMGL